MGDDDRINNQYHSHLGQYDVHQQNFQVPNLTLSLNLKPPAASATSTSAYDHKQLFGCRNCSRVFFSSQALGGHMNAHRKKTKAVLMKSNYKNKQPAAAPFPVSGPSLHTLGLVGSHALSGPEPSRDKAKFEPRSRDDESSEFRVPNLHEHIPVDARKWPGSFRPDDDQPYSPVHDSEDLDLNLRL